MDKGREPVPRKGRRGRRSGSDDIEAITPRCTGTQATGPASPDHDDIEAIRTGVCICHLRMGRKVYLFTVDELVFLFHFITFSSLTEWPDSGIEATVRSRTGFGIAAKPPQKLEASRSPTGGCPEIH